MRALIVPALVGGNLLMSACATQAQVADTIYHGGTILTMNGEAPSYAEAVAVKEGKIVFVGSKADALKRKGESTQVRDLGGKAMLPGFIDAHSHFIFALNMVNQVNVANPPVGPAQDILSTIAAIQAYQTKAKVPAGEWIVGWGYDSEGLKEGYTHAQEGSTFLRDLDFLLKAADEGKIFLDIAALPSFVDMPKWINNPKYRFGEYRKGLKLQGVKFAQDGSPQGKTADVSTPYLTGDPSGQPNWRGETTQPREDFLKQVKAAVDAGLQVFIHANGDATIDQAIEAVEGAGITAANDRRTVVIHSQFQRPDHLDKYVRLGMSPSYFTNHRFFWGDVHVKNIGPEKAAFISPVKAAKAKGIVFSNHTDFNVTPLDPFFVLLSPSFLSRRADCKDGQFWLRPTGRVVIWTAMKRESRSGQIIGPDQRVDAFTALQGLTTGAAWQLFEESRKGMIKEGLLADFVILSADPAKTGVDKIRDNEVLETIKEGKTIYRK